MYKFIVTKVDLKQGESKTKKTKDGKPFSYKFYNVYGNLMKADGSVVQGSIQSNSEVALGEHTVAVSEYRSDFGQLCLKYVFI